MAIDHSVLWLLLGFAVGSLGTLIGAGGGFLLVPILLIAFPQLSPAAVTAISMAIVAANAISGTIAYSRSGRIDFKAGILFALCTIPGSILGVWSTAFIPAQVFHWLFGVLMIGMAAFLYFSKGEGETTGSMEMPATEQSFHRLTDRDGNSYVYPFRRNLGIAVSVVVGYLSPVLGIGGGIIHVPALVRWLRFPVLIATATSHFILAVMATVSVVTHLYRGSYNDPLVRHLVILLAIGAIGGAQLGAWLSHRLNSGLILRALAFCLALVGLRILFG